MLDKTGFNKWAGSYDLKIKESSKGYPFEGYYDVLGEIHNSIFVDSETMVLDLGIGTGLLTNELYRKGAKITGLDFSEEMIKQAGQIMPKAMFYFYDFNDELPEEIQRSKYDYVVSSYAIHHVNDKRKILILEKLNACLKENGKFIIADIAFEDRQSIESLKEISRGWDEDEFYIIAEEFKIMLNEKGFSSKYKQISICGGVFEIDRRQLS